MSDTTVWLGAVVVRSAILILLVTACVALVYWMQRRHTLRELEAIAMQERHLYRMMQEQTRNIEHLRMIHHNAKNELIMLKGMLECGRNEDALLYVRELLQSGEL